MITFVACQHHSQDKHLTFRRPLSLKNCPIFTDKEYEVHISEGSENKEAIAGVEVSEDMWNEWGFRLAAWYREFQPIVLESMLETYRKYQPAPGSGQEMMGLIAINHASTASSR